MDRLEVIERESRLNSVELDLLEDLLVLPADGVHDAERAVRYAALAKAISGRANKPVLHGYVRRTLRAKMVQEALGIGS